MKHFIYLQAFAFVWTSLAGAQGNGDVLLRSTIGNPCQARAQCGNEKYACIPDVPSSRGNFPGGYCVKFECGSDNPCDAGTKCVEPIGLGVTVCLASCSQDSHCRNGYECNEAQVCVPKS